LPAAWFLDEDAALKRKLQGITVSDNNNAERPVQVFYREPQKEVTAQVYPFITIDLTAIQRDQSREMRGIFSPEYEMAGYDRSGLGANQVPVAELPIPVNLIYNVAVHSRNPLHDRQLVWTLLQHWYLPWRFGYLQVGEDDAVNGTVRRLDLMSVSPADYKDAQSIHVFRKVFTVTVSSEMLSDQVREFTKVEGISTELVGLPDEVEVTDDGEPIRWDADNPNEDPAITTDPAAQPFWRSTTVIQQS
jgi:hypothetical protein